MQQLSLDLTETLRGREVSWLSPDVTQIIRSWFSPGRVDFVPLTLNQCWIQPGPQRLWRRSQRHPSNDTFQSRGWTHSEHELWIRSQRLLHWRLMWTRWRTNWSWTDEDTRDQVQLDCVSREKADQVIRWSGDRSLNGSNREEDASSVHLDILSVLLHQTDVLFTRSGNLKLLKLEYCVFSTLHWTQYLFLLKEEKLRTNQNKFSRWPKSLK